MIAADTNLVAYLLIEGERTAAASRVWERDSDWRLPPLWRSEFLSVLATSVRSGVLTEEQGFRAWRLATRLFGRCEHEPGGEAVLRAALRLGISACDAHFVVVAEFLGVPLVTGDSRLKAACEIAVSIEEFAGLE
jgi:predicted nucleic acid-binding protein